MPIRFSSNSLLPSDNSWPDDDVDDVVDIADLASPLTRDSVEDRRTDGFSDKEETKCRWIPHIRSKKSIYDNIITSVNGVAATTKSLPTVQVH
jgi:hypothetical protein